MNLSFLIFEAGVEDQENKESVKYRRLFFMRTKVVPKINTNKAPQKIKKSSDFITTSNESCIFFSKKLTITYTTANNSMNPVTIMIFLRFGKKYRVLSSSVMIDYRCENFHSFKLPCQSLIGTRSSTGVTILPSLETLGGSGGRPGEEGTVVWDTEL